MYRRLVRWPSTTSPPMATLIAAEQRNEVPASSQRPPVSFEDARQIVARARRDVGTRGNYLIAEYGYESPQHWQIIDGARELIIDGDPAFLMVGEGPLLVDKFTGELIELPSLYDFDYLDTFTPVGDVPADDA